MATLTRSWIATLVYPLLALQLLFRVGPGLLEPPPNTLRGWAGLAGCLAWGASVLFLLRSVQVAWPAWAVAAAGYAAGLALVMLLFAVISAIGR